MLVPENPYHLAMNLDPETCGKDTPKLRTSTTTLVSDKVFCSCNLRLIAQAAARLGGAITCW